MFNAASPIILICLLLLAGFIVAGWVWGFVHAVGNHHLEAGDKVFFVLLMLVLGPIGTVIYFASLSGPAMPRHSHIYHRLHPRHRHHVHDHWHQPLP